MRFKKGIYVAACLGLGISSCNSLDLKNWLERTEELKLEALKQAEVTPYAGPQYKAMKDYFSELAELSFALQRDPKYAERFDQAISQLDLNAVCGQTLIKKGEWNYLMARCSKNNFFLCAEEVRAYPDILKAMREKLLPDQQRRFDVAPLCQEAP